MKILYSNILPMGLEDGQMSVADCFREQSERASSIEIAVGYVSKASLIELDEIIRVSNIRKVILTIGMYYVEGIPEAIYHTAMAINERWVNDGIGEIRLVRAFKYHGKTYAFYNEEDEVISVIIGSAKHPEVQGILGWAKNGGTVVESKEDALLFKPSKGEKPICVVAQTTFNYKKFQELV